MHVVLLPDYHSLQVEISVQRDQQHMPHHMTLRQTFAVVLRAPSSSTGRSLHTAARKPPRPGTLSDVFLGSLLGSKSLTSCPLAATSRLLLQLPQMPQVQQLSTLLKPPAYGPAVPGGTPGAGASSNATTCVSRPLTWTTMLFSLSPAPDAVAVLPAAHCVPATMGVCGDASSSSTAGCNPRVFYMYDLHNSKTGSTLVTEHSAGGALPPFSVSWQHQTAHSAGMAAAAAVPPDTSPLFHVSRYLTGTGQLRGGLVLHLETTQPTPAGSGNMTVCITQVVPWYVRLWLHTLQLEVNGQVGIERK